MPFSSRHFYQFSGIHSLLIGLLPFFLPVLLWNRGASLNEIAAFIATTGIGFIATLWCWDRLRFQQRWGLIISLSLLSELLLVTALAWDENVLFLTVLALLNGAYNCFYWSTQRAIFSDITSDENTGNTFGNFQILVVILLKLGILIGGYLLESQGMLSVLLLSVSICSVAWLPFGKWRLIKLQNTTVAPPLSLKHIIAFKDQKQSRLIFLIDGLFLFLESYFWVLSLYVLAQQSFLRLGIIVVLLTLLLSVLFYFIKVRIDRINPQRIYALAVVLYAVSWLLRGQLSEITNTPLLYVTIVTIAFLTTFFRLAFNKRFFDIARQQTPHQYLICKSYFSQFGIALLFGGLSILFTTTADVHQQLTLTYWLACPLSLLYGAYGLKSLHRLQHLDLFKNALFSPKQRFIARSSRLMDKR